MLSSRCPDIGKYDINEVRRFGGAAKAKLLSTHFNPPHNQWKAPLKWNGGCKRRCPKDFLLHNKAYPTIYYSRAADGLYCVECSIFRTGFVGKPFDDWSNAAKTIEKHYRSDEHTAACTKAHEFLTVFKKQKPTVLEQQQRMSDHDREVRRSAIKSIGRNLLLLGRQGLAIRGDTDARSNFNAILDLQQETDSNLKEHFSKAGAKEKCTSHRMQNDMIELLASQVFGKVITKVQLAKWYSLMVDESQDISTTEQVALILRYLQDTPSGVKVCEDFIKFACTDSITGEAITDLVMEKLHEWGLDLGYMVGQGYDGAGNMSGKFQGVQARITALHPDAVYVHCHNHRLNLALVDSVTVPPVRNMYNILEEVLKFLTGSAKRQAIYFNRAGGKEKLVRFCKTRWSHHSETVASFIRNYLPIIITLEILQSDDSKDVARDAMAYLKSVTSFEFIIALFTADELMAPMQPLSQALQNEQMDLVRASERAARIISMIQSQRSESESSFNDIWEKAVAFGAEHDIQPTKPRVVGRQVHKNNAPSTTPFDHYRINVYIPFTDFLIRELKDRLVKPLPRLKAEYLLPHRLSQLTPEILADIKQTYGHLLPSPSTLDTELKSWKHDVTTNHITSSDLAAAIDATPFLPNLNTIFRILLTMPVSTATAERSFSTLRRLKTWLRNRMGQERLTNLALLHIHQNIPVCLDQFLRDFDDGSRRIKL